MSTATPRLLLIDPLTLLGRELDSILPGFPLLAADVLHLHTAADEEHQIAGLAGAPVLVPPLSAPADLEGFDAVVVASEEETPRLRHLAKHIKSNPRSAVVFLGRASGLRQRARPAAGRRGAIAGHPLLRVAHPAVVSAVHVIEPLRDLVPVSVSVAAIDPVSFYGRDAVEGLAAQAARRLQGAASDEPIEGRTLAFNLVSVAAGEFEAEAVELLPGLSTTVTRTVAGVFYGHLTHLTVRFDGRRTAEQVEAAWRASDDLVVTEPLVLNDVTETDHVSVSRPRLSADGTVLAVSAMVDGLRLGGALTAVRILESLLAG